MLKAATTLLMADDDARRAEKIIPRELVANLRLRAKVYRLCARDREARQRYWNLCSRSPIAWMNLFGWCYDPRRVKTSPVRPWITWGFQEEGTERMIGAVGDHDQIILKSRDMGASTMTLLVFLWFWLFRSHMTFLLVSRKEELVDKKGNPDCLMWKLDFQLERLPRWMVPPYDRRLLSLVNLARSNTIDGSSSTSDTSRGGRRTGMLFDEFASDPAGYAVLAASRDVSDCRIFNSTPKGKGNAYYDLWSRAEKGESEIEALKFHWSLHPIKRRGLYQASEQGVKYLDPGYDYDSGYPFIPDGKLRSPWYDRECRRAANNREIAQELDCDFLGSDWIYWDPEELRRYRKECCRAPLHVGDFDPRSRCFVEIEGGPLKLWRPVDEQGRIPINTVYSLGADVSAGTGASNSCLCGIDTQTAEVVLSYTNPRIKPLAFGRLAAGIGRWMGTPKITAEGYGGPNTNFHEALVEEGYANLWHDQLSGGKQRDKPGHYLSTDDKDAMLSDLRDAMLRRRLVDPDEDAVDECGDYIWNDQGHIVHSSGARAVDPSGARQNHGDRVTARALALLGQRVAEPVEDDEVEREPVGSLAWRRKQREREEKRRPLAGWRK